MMESDQLLERLLRLQTWSANGQRAPHKPLLALWAIGRCLRGEERLGPYEEADRELTKLLRAFGPHRKSIHTEVPFWRLQGDGVWEVRDADRVTLTSKGDAHKSSLLKNDIHAGFPGSVHAALKDDAALAEWNARALVDAHFPPTIQEEVLEAVGIEAGNEHSRRKKRDRGFRARVLSAYGHACAMSSAAVQSQPTGTTKDSTVVVARLDDEVTWKRVVRLDKRRVALRPDSTNPEHEPFEIDRETDAFEIAGVAVGALIGDGVNGPEYENWGRSGCPCPWHISLTLDGFPAPIPDDAEGRLRKASEAARVILESEKLPKFRRRTQANRGLGMVSRRIQHEGLEWIYAVARSERKYNGRRRPQNEHDRALAEARRTRRKGRLRSDRTAPEHRLGSH